MQRFKRILVYAGSDENETAISHAFALAIENNASLTLMDVVKPTPRALGSFADEAKPIELEKRTAQDRRSTLLLVASEYSDTAVSLEVVIAVGDPATEIVRQVLVGEHDLVIKTADDFSPSGRIFHSVAKSLLRMCPCPVWLFKPKIHGEFDRVLAAIDVDSEDQSDADLNRKILELAYSIAQRHKAQLHIVSAWQDVTEQSESRRAGDDEVNDMFARHESKVLRALDELLQAPYADAKEITLHLDRGSAGEVIRWVADEMEADLMVMGTVCRTGIAGFLMGSTAESVIADLTCSLLALKPDKFVSPIEMAGFGRSEIPDELPLP